MSKNIGLLRGVFDPIHEGHYSNIISSISSMQLDELNIITKFLGDKDPIASLQQRQEMINIQLGVNEKIKIITQNIKGHIEHILELGEYYKNDNLIQIGGSDKINREMVIYGKPGDKFGVVKRDEFKMSSQTLKIAKDLGIILEIITPDFSTSSTYIRNELITNRENKPKGLHDGVYKYILENDLYILNKRSLNEYIKYWNGFIEYLNSSFPELELFKIDIPQFNNLQHKYGWKEKLIRHIVDSKGLNGVLLEEFVKRSLQYNY